MKRKNTAKIIKEIKKKLYSKEFIIKNRVSDRCFTRKRKLPFDALILFMINLIKQTLQKELTNFVQLNIHC